MSYAFILLMVCGHPAAAMDLISGRYSEFPEMKPDEAVAFVLKLTDALAENNVPYLVRDIGRDCE